MNKETNDFIIETIQDFNEIYSILKILKDSVNNENTEIEHSDISNALEIIIAKVHNSKLALDKCAEIILN